MSRVISVFGGVLGGSLLQDHYCALVGQSAPANVQPRGGLNLFDPKLGKQS